MNSYKLIIAALQAPGVDIDQQTSPTKNNRKKRTMCVATTGLFSFTEESTPPRSKTGAHIWP